MPIASLIILVSILAGFYFLRGKTVFFDRKKLKNILRTAIVYMAVVGLLFTASLPVSGGIKLLSLILLLFSAWKGFIHANDVFDENSGYALRLDLFLIFAGVLALGFSTLEKGGLSFFPDWMKQRTILFSLYDDPLSPRLNYFISPAANDLRWAPLVYYYGLYLPGVYLTRLISLFIKFHDTAMLSIPLSAGFILWCYLGVILGCLLIPPVYKKISGEYYKGQWGYFFLLLLIISAPTYWIKVMETKSITPMFTEWALPYFALPFSFISQWLWSLQHSAATILSLCILLLYKDRLFFFPLALWSVFTLASSAFAWLANLPIFLYLLCRHFFVPAPAEKNTSIYSLRTEFLIAVILCVQILVFYNSKLSPEHLTFNKSLYSWCGGFMYLFYMFLQMLPFMPMIAFFDLKKINLPLLVWISFFMIWLLPLFQMGRYNDLAMRIPVSYILIILIFGITTLLENRLFWPKAVKLALTAYLLICLPNFINVMALVFNGKTNSGHLMFIAEEIRQYAGSKKNIWEIKK